MRLGGNGLQSPDPLARQRAHLLRHFLRCGRERVVFLKLDAHDARWLRRAISGGKRRAKRDRHLAEDDAGNAPAERALDPVDDLDDLDLAGKNGKERGLGALVSGELPGSEMEVGASAGETLPIGSRKGRKQRDRRNVLNGQHGSPR